MRIFITGGTGLVGSRLVPQLIEREDEVVILSRRPETAQKKFPNLCQVVAGDPTQQGPWQDEAANCDAVIHLAGEGIFARRWSDEFMKTLYDSRILSTRHVVEALRRTPQRADGQPKVLVNASAIGFYGPRDDEELTEDSGPGEDFLARLCVDWEREARTVEEAGVRCVMVRVGIVLDKEGGALAKMLTPFQMYAGGPVASGKQWMSWIHHEDLRGIIKLGLDHTEAHGPLNGTAPNPVRNRDFSKVLGKVLHRPSFVWTPGFALRLALGKASQLVTTGQRVLPRRVEQLGYQFQFPELEGALTDILGSQEGASPSSTT